ncbi:hypothetical protein AAF712_014827, partial [Marasmius tenuissimus]
AGSFVIYIYDKQGPNGVITKPEYLGKWTAYARKAFPITVFTNPTSVGAIAPPSQSPSGPLPSNTSNTSRNPGPDVGLVVGLILGITVIVFTIVTAFLCIRYRRRHATMAFQRSKMMGVGTRSMTETRVGWDEERKSGFKDRMSTHSLDYNPPAPSEYSSGSFSATSPIARAMRERERRNNKLLRLSSSTITSGTHSTTTSTPSYISPLPRTRTDRQMLIEEKIQLLQSKMILLQSQRHTSIQSAGNTPRIRPLPLPPGSVSASSPPLPIAVSGIETEELERLERTVERLKQLHESNWALMLTDIAPEGLHD